LKFDEAPSNFAFNVNLRRYTPARRVRAAAARAAQLGRRPRGAAQLQGRAVQLEPMKPMLKVESARNQALETII
jgi:hypothetical protein